MTAGSFRTIKPLTEDECARIQELKEEYRMAANGCFGNAALLACETATDSEPLTYVEGLVVPPEGGYVIRHAWVELHGKVVEVTWPDGIEPHPTTAYYGIEVPVELVREHRAGDYIVPITHPRNPAQKKL